MIDFQLLYLLDFLTISLAYGLDSLLKGLSLGLDCELLETLESLGVRDFRAYISMRTGPIMLSMTDNFSTTVAGHFSLKNIQGLSCQRYHTAQIIVRSYLRDVRITTANFAWLRPISFRVV